MDARSEDEPATRGGSPDARALRGAVALAISLGQVDRETGELALEQLDASPEDAGSAAQVAFLLDLDEAVVAELARVAAEHPGEDATTALRSRLFGASDRSSPLTVDDLRALDAGFPEEPPLTGQVIDGFEIGDILGEGGMGRVYRARQASVHRDVALKVLPAHRIGDSEAARRFLREGRAAAALNHPNVVTCHGMGRSGDRLWVAMELLPGGDLEARTRKHGGRLPERKALAIVRDACEGLAALEAAGLVHRDIKPANIFLAADGRAKLGDLGLACSRIGDDRVTRTGLVVGTPVYMAPEQAEGLREPDIRADIYALGATLYRLVTGQPPYSGSELSILRSKLDAPPPDPRQARREVSPALARLVMRAMARRPEDRPRTARAFLAEIDATAAALDAGSPRVNGRHVALALAVIAAIAVAVTLSVTRDRTEPVIAASPAATAPPASPPARAVSSPGDLRPSSGSFAIAQEDGWLVEPGDEDWRRTSLVDAASRSLPMSARFRVRAEASRDAPPGVLGEQGFAHAGGFFHEIGARAENTEIDAGAKLERFALWLTLVTDASGDARALLRAIGPRKQPGMLARGAPGVAILSEFALPSAFSEGPLDVAFELDESGWRCRVVREGAELRADGGPWADAGLEASDIPATLHLWAHAGNWASGRGRGTLEAAAD